MSLGHKAHIWQPRMAKGSDKEARATNVSWVKSPIMEGVATAHDRGFVSLS